MIVSIFHRPVGLVEVASFSVPKVKTWGQKDDALFKAYIQQASGITHDIGKRYCWFVFSIKCIVGSERDRGRFHTLDVENIPKLIIDAFTGLLYDDDNLHFVRGVQVEADWGPPDAEATEVVIYGYPFSLE